MSRIEQQWYDDCWGTAVVLFLLLPLVIVYIAVRYAVEAVKARRAGA